MHDPVCDVNYRTLPATLSYVSSFLLNQLP